MGKLREEGELADRIYAALEKGSSASARSRLRIKLEDLGDSVDDELELFKVFHKVFRQDKALDEAMEELGFGKISEFNLLEHSAEQGLLVQGFSTMYETYFGAEGVGSQKHFLHQNTGNLVKIKLADDGGSRMRVNVHAGRKLVVRDIISSDPYCVLSYSDPGYDQVQRRKTEVVKRNLSPVWKTAMDFKSVTSGGKILIEVWDQDMIGEDDFMGRVVISMSEINFAEGKHDWFALEGVQSGEIRVRIAFLD
jgi:hypothetical protein